MGYIDASRRQLQSVLKIRVYRFEDPQPTAAAGLHLAVTSSVWGVSLLDRALALNGAWALLVKIWSR
jgi:hypothetical protein